ncbi:hypothetical protein V7S43_012151 [Phytophthora oleae]|uniref:RxLR effector protein n=1 Tax=Phytophthora oleae TaxID=2107226 RepID=A0ABD3F7A4_9STRA
MRKVSGRIPPLLQHGKSTRTASIDEGNEDLLPDSEETAEKANPTGTYVFWQNRKLSPKKRALESVLKKKHQERLQTEKRMQDGTDSNDTDVPTTARAAVALDTPPRPKTLVSPTKRALQNMGSKMTHTSLGSAASISDSETGEKKLIETSDKVAPVVSEEFERSPSSGIESRAATEASNMAPKTLAKAEEAKPFGAYMLLSKQPPPFRPPATTDPNDSATSPRPPTAQKTKPTDAQSALLKALKKQKSKK